jgi:hypothetical protein
MEKGKVMVAGSDVACHIDPSVFNMISMQPLWWCHIHHPRNASTCFEARLGNYKPTCFHVKQATRSWRVPRANSIILSVLWRNRQTVAWLILSPNQETVVVILRPKLLNRSCWFWVRNHQTVPVVLKPNHWKPSQWFWGQTIDKPLTLFLRLNQETHASRLLVHGADRTQRHPTSRSSGHWVLDLCLTIPSSLH